MFRAKILLHTYFQTVSKDPQSKCLPLATYLRRRTHDHPDFGIVFLRGRAPEVQEPDIRYRQVALAQDVSRIRGYLRPRVNYGIHVTERQIVLPVALSHLDGVVIVEVVHCVVRDVLHVAAATPSLEITRQR